MLNNTKLRHFWAQIVSWAPRHARKTFIVLAPCHGDTKENLWYKHIKWSSGRPDITYQGFVYQLILIFYLCIGSSLQHTPMKTTSYIAGECEPNRPTFCKKSSNKHLNLRVLSRHRIKKCVETQKFRISSVHGKISLYDKRTSWWLYAMDTSKQNVEFGVHFLEFLILFYTNQQIQCGETSHVNINTCGHTSTTDCKAAYKIHGILHSVIRTSHSMAAFKILPTSKHWLAMLDDIQVYYISNHNSIITRRNALDTYLSLYKHTHTMHWYWHNRIIIRCCNGLTAINPTIATRFVSKQSLFLSLIPMVLSDYFAY